MRVVEVEWAGGIDGGGDAFAEEVVARGHRPGLHRPRDRCC